MSLKQLIFYYISENQIVWNDFNEIFKKDICNKYAVKMHNLAVKLHIDAQIM